jgi:hypothetical protein
MLPQLLLALVVASPPTPDPTTRDGLFTEAAAVAAASIRFSTGGGASVARDGGAVGPLAGASVLWALGRGLAAGVEVTKDGDSFAPAATLRYQLLSQESWPANAAALVRYKSVGFRGVGSEVEAEVMLSRSVGRLVASGAGVIGKAFKGESAVDLEGKAALAWTFTEALRAGLESRLRAEVALGNESTRLPGREFDLVAGPAAAWRIDRVEVQAIVGLGIPRGTASPGPMGLLLLTFDQ